MGAIEPIFQIEIVHWSLKTAPTAYSVTSSSERRGSLTGTSRLRHRRHHPRVRPGVLHEGLLATAERRHASC
jgi:hypothetical protein